MSWENVTGNSGYIGIYTKIPYSMIHYGYGGVVDFRIDTVYVGFWAIRSIYADM